MLNAQGICRLNRHINTRLKNFKSSGKITVKLCQLSLGIKTVWNITILTVPRL